MLKIAICDDQPSFLAEISSLLDQWKGRLPGMPVKCFSDGDSLIAAHRSDPFDVILLDVVMPLIDGIETARELRSFDPGVKIVFLTSSPEFAVEFYTVKASNYLLKPVNSTALYRCLDELISELQHSTMSITVKSSVATYRVPLDKIEHIEACNKHTVFALSDGDSMEALGLMNTYESKLLSADGFLMPPQLHSEYTSDRQLHEQGYNHPLRAAHPDLPKQPQGV